MSEGSALIEMPDGSPGAVSDAGTSLGRVAGGFENAGTTVARASATVPAWEGRARVSFDGRIASYGLVMVAVRQALTSARSAVRKYESALEDARAKLRRLREQEEMAIARLKRAKEQLAEAQGRLAGAQYRLSAVSHIPSPAAEPFALAERAAAQMEADAAQADIDAAQRQIDRERDEIRELREDARRVRRELVQAEEDAAGEVRAAAAGLPDVQLPGGAASPSAHVGTVFAGPLSPFARDPRWGSAMSKAAADDEPEEPGFFEKAWNHAMENFGAGTPLDVPLKIADEVSPGFREDFGRAVTEDLATGLYATGKMGVQLSPAYRMIDPAGSDRAARQLQAIGQYAYRDPWGFTKDVSGITDIEEGHPGTAFGNWALVAAPGGAAVKVAITPAKVTPNNLPPLDQRADLTPREGTARHADDVPYGPSTREQHLADLRRQADEAGVDMPTQGMEVERTFGSIPDSRAHGVLDGSGPYGESWTPASIADMKAPRDEMGLPHFNGGRFVIRGRLEDPAAISEIRSALPWNGPGGYFQRGGAPEYVIPNAADHVRITSVRGVNPDF